MASEGNASEKKTVKGSCHCGAIKYEARIPKDLDTITKCNCTMCQKPGMITIPLDTSGADFDLLSPKDESEVKYYQFRSKDCYRFFCDKCGVQVWGKGKYTFEGKDYLFFSVNAHTLDQPQDGLDVSELKVNYVDGLNDNWMAGTKEKPFPGSMP